MLLFPNNNTVSKFNNIPIWTVNLYEPDLERLASGKYIIFTIKLRKYNHHDN